MKNKKEFVIGVVTALTLIVFYWGLNFLKGEDLLTHETEYTVIYKKVAGLNTSNPVRLIGHQVGKVSHIEIQQVDSSAQVLVRIKIDDELQLPKNTVAKIESDLLGVNTISLVLGNSKENAAPGDTLLAAIATSIQEEVSLQMQPIKIKAEEMMSSLDSILGAIKYVFNEDTRQSLRSSFQSINNSLKNLESASSVLDTMLITESNRLGRILANVDAITLNLRDNDSLINSVIFNFATLSDSLAQIDFAHTMSKVDNVLSDLSSVTEKINSGEGSMGQLIHNDTLYKELEATARELHLLTEDMKLNPQRYVHFSVFGRGGKKNEYKAPAKKEDE